MARLNTGKLSGVLHDELDGLHLRLNLFAWPAALLPHFAFSRTRTLLYRLGGIRIGNGSIISGKIEIVGPGAVERKLTLGERCLISAPLYADVAESITIGNHVYIGHHVILATSNHEIGDSGQRCGFVKAAPISIEDGVWIGASCTILPGVTIGRGAVIAAGAVVNKNVEPNTLVGGVPAKKIRDLEAS